MSKPKKDGHPRKVRRDARLKDLPPEQRDMVREWLDQDGWQSACARCSSELGISISRSKLYEAIAFWDTQAKFDRAFAYKDAQEELMKKFRPDDAKLAREFGEFMLLQAANEKEDKDIFAVATIAQDSRRNLDQKDVLTQQRQERLEQHKEVLKLERQKVQRQSCKLFVKWYENDQAKQILSGGGTNAEKIEALGRAMFGEDWEDVES